MKKLGLKTKKNKKPSAPNKPMAPIPPDKIYIDKKIQCGIVHNDLSVFDIVRKCQDTLCNDPQYNIKPENIDLGKITLEDEHDYYDGHDTFIYYTLTYEKPQHIFDYETKSYLKKLKQYNTKKLDYDKKHKIYEQEMIKYKQEEKIMQDAHKKKLYEELKQEFENAGNTQN